MTTMRQRAGVLLAFAVLFGSQTAWAQAVFRVSSSTTTVIRTGHAEPVGELTFWVDGGITVEGTIEIDLRPAVLTSDEDDICVSTGATCIPGSGTTGAFSPTVDRAAGRVRLRVPPGLGPGTLVTVSGLLLSVPASGIERLEARISADGNRLAASSTPVIERVADAIVIDPSTDFYTPTTRPARASTISVISPSAKDSPRRSTTPTAARKSFSKPPRCHETPSSGSRQRLNRNHPAPRSRLPAAAISRWCRVVSETGSSIRLPRAHRAPLLSMSSASVRCWNGPALRGQAPASTKSRSGRSAG